MRPRLVDEVRRRYPALADAEAAVRDGRILVDGFPVKNPASIVREGASIVLAQPRVLRGEAKLRAALDAFGVRIAGRVALDVGAAAGGFTRVLLDEGAAKVYAVDAGHGQLLGSLRQDERVVNLEATNLGDLDTTLVPDVVDVVTIDVSYLSVTAAVPQLERVAIAPDADLIALVKPMFELSLAAPPEAPDELERALTIAVDGIAAAGWRVVSSVASPVAGAHGAREQLVHATRRVRATD